MKTIPVIIFFFLITKCSGQQWMEKMIQPGSNYYEVERSYLQWKDSMEQANATGLFRKFFQKEKIERNNELLEEADEHFHHWANQMKMRMDQEGNPISSREIQKQYNDYRQAIESNRLSLTQGSWIPRGPFATPLGNSIRGIGRVFPIAISEVDTNIVFACTPASGIFKSSDGGNNWQQIEDSVTLINPPLKMVLDPLDTNIIYTMTSNGVFKSSDGGFTWTIIISLPYPNLCIDPINPLNLFAYQGTRHNRSTDGGMTWTSTTGIYLRDLKYKPFNSQIMYALRGSDIFRSDDGGQTFDSVTTINTAYNSYELAVTPADTNYVYVFTGSNSLSSNGGQVAVSSDGGNTFNLQPFSTNIYCFGDMTHLAVSQTDKNTLSIGGVYLSTSTDGGATWNVPSTAIYPSPHPDHRSIQYVGNTLWTGNDGGVYKITPGSVNYTDMSSGLNVAEFNSISCSESDTSVFTGGALDNALILHTDSGWVNIFAGDGFDACINPADPLIIFGKNQYGYMRTFDGGITEQNHPQFFSGITESSYAFNAGFPIAFSKQNPRTLFHLVQNVWKGTNNYGDAVTNISNFTSATGGSFLYVCETDSNIIFTAYHKTLNGGISWSDFSQQVAAADPDEPNKVWSYRSNHGIKSVYFSSDTGNTWQLIPSLDINPLGNCQLMCANNSTDGIFLVKGAVVYYIDNTLSNWQPFNNGLPYVGISDLEVLPFVNKVRISTFGRGIWESDLFDISQDLAVDFIADKTTICPGQAVQFYDNSLNNGPAYNPIYQWSFPGGTPSVDTGSHPLIYYYTPGVYSVSLHIINSNGNDSITKTLFIEVSAPPLNSLPVSENFETGIFPPTGWDWNQSLSNRNWNLNTSFGGYANSTNSLLYRTWTNTNSDADQFLTPFLDFSTLPSPALTFDYCYPYDYDRPDTLKLFYTTDCGNTKTYFYSKGGLDLKTDSTYSNYAFSPLPTSWKTDTIGLAALSALGQIQVGFEVNSNKRCEVYIDNINFNSISLTSLPSVQLEKNLFNISPNPAKDRFDLLWESSTGLSADYMIRDYLGQLISSGKIQSNDILEINTEILKSGIYFISLLSHGMKYDKLLVVQK